MFVCLVVLVPIENFAPVKECKILTYTRHSWSLSNDVSLACHAYCDTGHPFMMVGQLGGHVTLASVDERLAVELSLPGFFLKLRAAAARILTPNLPHARRTL